MARFRFRLEALLTARQEIERRHQREVADFERQRRDLEDTLRRHQQFITEGQAALRDRLVGAIEVDKLRTHAGTTLQLMRAAQRLVLEAAEVHQRLEEARARLASAAADRRAIELLRERRYEAWRRKIERAEDALIDELANRPKREWM
ncbi:MAG: hypothetical protein HKO59_17620 [Phycisphaerales bacterium]|nr:flagellar FliJ family protein [Phycisphaerae bacterium]NNF44755.1 hypothetical protein [Phycisphaerales bacterium]NNM27762.1 hypothetical protein [Phycisphaerales bacterium]